MIAIQEQVADYKPLFQYFGGKSRVAQTVWNRLGNVKSYVEPFFGSGAMLFRRPPSHFENGERRETVNDFDGMIANFWRAVQTDPDAVAAHADWPCNEIDLTARHIWLVNNKASLAERMMADETYFDAKFAGWWVWGLCWWIGTGFATGEGCWNTDGEQLVKRMPGVNRKLPHLADDGRGVNRKLPLLSSDGQGVNRPAPWPPHDGRCEAYSAHVRSMIRVASDRLRRVRVCCGDWSRVVTPSAAGYTTSHPSATVGVFLDPPYGHTERSDCYTHEDYGVAAKVREWAKSVADDPRLRICIAGYDGEHNELESAGWSVVAWKSSGMNSTGKGHTRGDDNAAKERLWFSPHCLKGNECSTS